MYVTTVPAEPLPFQTFYVEQRGRVLRLLVGMVGAVDAEDCFQECFLKALRAWPPPRTGPHLDAWVLTIAHRTALDLVRRRGREVAMATVPEVASVDQLATLDASELGAAVRGLPPRQRAAVVLRAVLDLSHASIGEVLGCTEAAARRSYADGVGALRVHGDVTIDEEDER